MTTRDYVIRMPPDLKVVAACEDVGCDQWRRGWETVCDLDDPMGATVAFLIRSGQTGRTCQELPALPGSATAVFRFESGQRCFREHRTRPARFSVRAGGRVVTHARLADWGEDLADHAGRLQDQLGKG
ncbi:MAG: hypothetical protein ACRDVE_02500 [Actinocrinis sp.]